MSSIKTPVELELIYADVPENDEADIIDVTGRTIAQGVRINDAHEILVALNSREALKHLAKSILDSIHDITEDQEQKESVH